MSAVVIDFNDVMPAKSRPERYDLDLIVRRLRETAEHWVPWLFPRGRRSGDEWRLANIHGDPPRNTGSCVIALRGPHAGDWIDFDGNQDRIAESIRRARAAGATYRLGECLCACVVFALSFLLGR